VTGRCQTPEQARDLMFRSGERAMGFAIRAERRRSTMPKAFDGLAS